MIGGGALSGFGTAALIGAFVALAALLMLLVPTAASRRPVAAPVFETDSSPD